MCLGQFSRLFHWGPMTALGIIKLVTGMTIHCGTMWWPPITLYGAMNTMIFLIFSGMTLYNFLSSMFLGPGYLPKGWEPKDSKDAKFLQWCGVCEGFKAPRSHHCRKCGFCVLKMDHHCPWINNCVGWGNHAHFTSFLFFATLGCFQASVVLGCALYRSIFFNYYLYYGTGLEPMVHLTLPGKILTIFALGFAIGVVIAVGLLLFFQFRGILRNRTGIEDWIVEKADYRRRNTTPFVFPYDLGYKKNFTQVINFSCQPVGDGIFWPVVDSCDQFTLTKEQKEQKDEKRQRSKLYRVVEPASGAIFPLTKGIRTCLNFPCNDEPRIKLAIGETVIVTRWRKLWLFGEKVQEKIEGENSNRIKGWFPKRCAMEVMENNVEKKKN